MQQLEVIKEYKDSVAFYAECGSYHTLVLSYKPPTQKGKDRTKRRRPNEYLENNPIQFAK